MPYWIIHVRIQADPGYFFDLAQQRCFIVLVARTIAEYLLVRSREQILRPANRCSKLRVLICCQVDRLQATAIFGWFMQVIFG